MDKSSACWSTSQFSDAVGVGLVPVVGVEDGRQAFEEGVFPQSHEGRAELVLAAHLGLRGRAGEQLENDLRLELGRERAAGRRA